MNQKIRIKLKSYDHNLVDKSAEKIVKTVKSTGAIVSGPIPLPTHKRIYTVFASMWRLYSLLTCRCKYPNGIIPVGIELNIMSSLIIYSIPLWVILLLCIIGIAEIN